MQPTQEFISLADRLSKFLPDQDSNICMQAKNELTQLKLSGVTEYAKLNLPLNRDQYRDAIVGIEDGKIIIMVSINLGKNIIDMFRNYLQKEYGATADDIEFRKFGVTKIKTEMPIPETNFDDTKRHFERLKSKIVAYSSKEGILYKESDMKKEQEIANQVLLALASTLTNSAEICLSKNVKEYTYSAEVFLALLEMIDMLGANQLQIIRDTGLEKRHKAEGESEIYHFKAKNIRLSNGRTVEWLKILIRPNDLLGATSDDVREIISQARFKAQYKIKESVGIANIRIDPPDPRLENNIVIDLEISDKKNRQQGGNLIDELELNQKAGHHFNSGVNIADFGDLKPADIHRAIANRLIQISAIQ